VRHTKLLPVILLSFFLGCATAPKIVVNDAMTVDELRYRLLQTADSLKDFSAEGSITIVAPSMNQSAGFEVSARKTDSLKMSVFGPFGITVGSALFTRNEFTAYNALNNTVYRGAPEKQLRMLPFVKDIPFELLVGSLQGIHPFRSASIIDSFETGSGRTPSFTVINNDGSFDKFRYDENSNRITQCIRRNGDSKILWSVNYRYKRLDDGSFVPEQVEVNVPSKETTLLLDYAGVTYGAISPALTISYPDDAEIITIE
jgi:hypothetical protein